jgi:hypothetical protein
VGQRRLLVETAIGPSAGTDRLALMRQVTFNERDNMTKREDKRRIQMWSKGLSGWWGQGHNTMWTGFGSDVTQAVKDDGNTEPGAYVIDKSEVEGIVRLVLAAPLILFMGEPRPIYVSPGALVLADAVALDHALVRRSRAGEINLDESKLEAYVEYWRSAGAKIGQWWPDQGIVWE